MVLGPVAAGLLDSLLAVPRPRPAGPESAFPLDSQMIHMHSEVQQVLAYGDSLETHLLFWAAELGTPWHSAASTVAICLGKGQVWVQKRGEDHWCGPPQGQADSGPGDGRRQCPCSVSVTPAFPAHVAVLCNGHLNHPQTEQLRVTTPEQCHTVTPRKSFLRFISAP